MELLYLWINCSDHNCIIQQEFNFSPLYTFKVDSLETPGRLMCEKREIINLFNTNMDSGKISNITAVVGANGAGKTTLLSYIANNNCFYKFERTLEYERDATDKYEHNKSIYVYYDHDAFVIYHNLEKNLTCDFDVLQKKIYWNSNKQSNIKQLSCVRKELIIYLSNSSFVPEALSGFSQSDKTYNINLHQRSMHLVANRFYNALFGKSGFDHITESDQGFAWIIKENRDDRKFQELLDIQYYQYLLENEINDFAGIFKNEINIYFENIIGLIETKYLKEFEIIKAIDSDWYKLNKQKPDKEPSDLIRKYYEKIVDFESHYNLKNFENARRKNCTIVLYFNLLFEIFFYEKDFMLPPIDLNLDLNKQLIEIPLPVKYKEYLEDIKKLDDILRSCSMNKNLIDNPDDLACLYEKIVCKKNTDFYEYIHNMFSKRESYTLRYIRIRNLDMSSGERAMQNLFSWLVLIPELDKIMDMKRSDYKSKLILIDEIDLYSHPEWQRKIISQLIYSINKIEKEKPVQIVLSSHSPFILSDFPRENIIYLNKYKGKTIVDNNNNHQQSFGANIYTLLKEAFFLENGAVGEFAKEKIYEVYEDLKTKEYSDGIDESKQKSHQVIINMIGDKFLRNQMKLLFNKKYLNNKHIIIEEEPKNVGELEELKKQLENSLEAVKKMLVND